MTALDAVDFAVDAGSVHALVGENGAGKSTLLKIMAGAEQPDAGQVALLGREVEFATPRAALDRGITVIYQELALVPQLGADANIFLGMEPTRGFRLDRSAMRTRAAEALAMLGLDIDPGTRAGALSVAQQQLVELARALVRRAAVIALDEPTATLTAGEVAHLFTQVEHLKAQGAGIVFVSHRLDEIRRLADTITVLRDGRAVWSGPAADRTDREIIQLMVGRDLEYARLRGRRPADPQPYLEVRNLRHPPTVKDVSFSVSKGEIVALAGLVGAGRTEVARCLAGADRPADGVMHLGGEPYAPRTPREAIDRGVAYLPEDRKRDGLVLGLPVGDNVTLPSLARFTTRGVLDGDRERDAARTATQQVQLKPPRVDRPTRTLSGGNQQKVVLAKWLLVEATVLIFDEPTRGVDVGTKVELHRQIRALADDGKAVIVISSELPEVLAVADRVVVIRDGGIAGELPAAAATAERIMALAVTT